MSVKIILLLAVAAAANASSPYICRGYCPGQEDESPYAEHSRLYGRGYAVNQDQKKGLCSAKVQVLKPKSRDVDFWVCAKADKTGVCTLKREVAECSSAAKQCYGLQPHHQTQFNDLYAGAHAQVCVEPSGVQCLITNIAYTRCTSKDVLHSQQNVDDSGDVCIIRKDNVKICKPHTAFSGPAKGSYE